MVPARVLEFADDRRGAVAVLSALAVPAAESRRIHLIDGTLVSWYGPRIGLAIQTLRPLLRGPG